MSLRTENLQKRIASLEAWAKLARQHSDDAGVAEGTEAAVVYEVQNCYRQMSDQLERQAETLRGELETEHAANAMLELVDRFIDDWGKLAGVRPPSPPFVPKLDMEEFIRNYPASSPRPSPDAHGQLMEASGLDNPETAGEPCRACRGDIAQVMLPGQDWERWILPHTCGAGPVTAHKTVGDLVKNPWERTVILERAIRRALHGCIFCRQDSCRADAHDWLARALGETAPIREYVYEQDSGREQ